VDDSLGLVAYAQHVTASTFPGETFWVLKEKNSRNMVSAVPGTWYLKLGSACRPALILAQNTSQRSSHCLCTCPWPDGTPYQGPGLVLDESLFKEEQTEYIPPAKKSSQISEPYPELPTPKAPQPIDLGPVQMRGFRVRPDPGGICKLCACAARCARRGGSRVR
jgi:hypothetical protein